MAELLATAIAFATVELSLIVAVWNLRGQLAAESASIRESINKIELMVASDREKNDGRYQLLQAEMEGIVERTDYRFSLLDQRIKHIERRLDNNGQG